MMPLRRTLRATDLVLLVIGPVIGSGIFIAPSYVLQQAGGNVAIASFVWFLGGVLTLFGALSYAELAAMQHGSGGLYAYIRDGIGPFPAFLYGWTLFFVIVPGTIAVLAVSVVQHVGQFAGLSDPWSTVPAVGLIALMTAINVLGTRRSASVQNVVTAIKVVAILSMSVLLFSLGDGSGALPSAPATGTTGASMAAVGLAMITVLWAYEGWHYVTFVDGEAIEPQRAIPRALILGTAALMIIYLAASYAYVAALGANGVMASTMVAREAVTVVLGPNAGKLVALAIVISLYSVAHALFLTAPRVYCAMAQDRQFFPQFGAVHSRWGTPAWAIIASGAWSAVLMIVAPVDQLLSSVGFGAWIFYALGAAAVITLRMKRPDADRPFKVPGYPLTPALFILGAAAIVVYAIVGRPAESAIGIYIVLIGAPAYRWTRYPTWYPEALKKYFDFSGRARRKEYWMFFLLNLTMTVMLLIIEGLAGIAQSSQQNVLVDMYGLAVLIPSIAVGIRRMHDTDRSGWWLLVPIANLVFLIQDSQQADNRFGPNPAAAYAGEQSER